MVGTIQNLPGLKRVAGDGVAPEEDSVSVDVEPDEKAR